MGNVKRLFVTSDIHGHCTILKETLYKAGFDEENEDHLFICCGDLFDRGNENRQVYDFVRKLKNKVLVCGNHDERLLNIILGGKMNIYDEYNGTDKSVREFFGENSIGGNYELKLPKYGKMAGKLSRFVGSMKNYYETEHYIFVHGWVPTKINDNGKRTVLPDWRTADGASWKSARFSEWTSLRGINDMITEKTVVCGHRPTQLAAMFDSSRSMDDSSIYYGKNLIALDAGTIRSARMNILVLDDSILP